MQNNFQLQNLYQTIQVRRITNISCNKPGLLNHIILDVWSRPENNKQLDNGLEFEREPRKEH